MKLPFSTQDFLEIFRQYNNSVYPMQFLLFLLSLMMIYLTIRPRPSSSIFISSILAFLWLWMGILYHIILFSAINPAAYFFGFLFIIQGILFLLAGYFKKSLSFHFKSNGYGIAGAIIILYALIVYPVLGYFYGHVYPYSPTFGLPCPTTIFTFGILLWTDKKVPLYILFIPLLWSVTGFTAALNLGIAEDTGLIVAGALAGTMIIIRNRVILSKL